MTGQFNKNIFSVLVALVLCLSGWGQYAGAGVFDKINSISDLTDGYYVFVNSGNTSAMSNVHNGTFLLPAAITPVNDAISNPDASIVWYIGSDGGSKSIYNHSENVYISYTGSSNNVQLVNTINSDNQRWDITHNGSVFTVANAALPARMLQYNAGSPRFACYTSNQQRILMYRLDESTVNNPAFMVSASSLSNLDYVEGDGPSSSGSMDLSGVNLNGGNVIVGLGLASVFEISTDNNTFVNSISLPSYSGASTTIYVRLKAGLAPAMYNESLTISGAGVNPDVAVNLSGAVIEPFALPYFNGLRNQTAWDDAIALGFVFNGTSFQTASNGYVRIPSSGSGNIVSPSLDLSTINALRVSFDMTTFGGSGASLAIFISEDDGATYTHINTIVTPGQYATFTEVIDVSAMSSTQGRIKFQATGSNQLRFRDLYMSGYNYFYDMTAWIPSDPSGVGLATDNIWIASGEATFTADTEVNNIDIASGAILNIEGVLKINGDIINAGELVFLSNATTTAQLDEVPLTSVISGNVTVHRYIPARRAFRLLSSAVTTTGSINANWQEGANNPDLTTNVDPNPGYGTHISGSTNGANGFDATPTGNPSLFTLNNPIQSWIEVANTDVNTLQAGKPYRILVRGDRDIDVTNNSAAPTNTTLRSTGTIYTGTFTTNSFSQNATHFNFFGNPYQAIVDMNSVLTASTNINPGFYYIWDPALNGDNGRGAYITVELPNGTNPSNSHANEFLQPGQAAFVTTLANGPASLTMEEGHKAVDQPQTTVFDSPVKLDLRLYDATAYANSNTPSDGLRIKFVDNGHNAINSMDAPKFYNQDENLATIHNGKLYSMETRAVPQIGEGITLYTDQYRATDYIFEADLNNLEGVSAYLRDTFTGDEILLENDAMTIYSFNINPGNAASTADDRFEIFFTEETLGNNDPVNGNDFVVFPNPVENNIFFIATRGMEGESVSLSVTNMLGQNIIDEHRTINNGGKLQVNLPELPAGIYTVTMKAASGNRFTTKLINR